jgi:hypothetical protein
MRRSFGPVFDEGSFAPATGLFGNNLFSAGSTSTDHDYLDGVLAQLPVAYTSLDQRYPEMTYDFAEGFANACGLWFDRDGQFMLVTESFDNAVILIQRQPGYSAPSGGNVTGRVTDIANGNPVANATIKFADISVETDANGVFNLAAVPPGQQEISASRWGFDSASATVDVSANGNATQDFQIRREPAGDYDGGGKTDVLVWRQGNPFDIWNLRNSSDGSTSAAGWGAQAYGDVPVPADYDGDGMTDVAIWRSTTGNWYFRNTSTSTLTALSLGKPNSSDIPVPGDYDGDGKADAAIFSPESGVWSIFSRQTGATTDLSVTTP